MNYTKLFFQLFLVVTIILGAVVTYYFDDLSYLYEPKSNAMKMKEFFVENKNCPNI